MHRNRNDRRSRLTPRIEALEVRCVLSAVMETEPNNVLTAGTPLGAADGLVLEASGTIGTGTDVDWFDFTLADAAEVTLTVSSGVVGLYNDAGYDPFDNLTPNGNRLLQQAAATTGNPGQIVRQLAAGTYHVAISGAGNLYFNPLLADSGIAGETGSYDLTIAATGLNIPPLTVVPLAVDASAVAFRITFNSPDVDVSSVQLFDSNANELFPVVNFNAAVNELQVYSPIVLPAGTYTVLVNDLNGTPLGPISVVVTAEMSEPIGGDDTPTTAIELATVGSGNLIQVAGFIGDDPYYDFMGNTESPGNDVDLYHFAITSSTPQGLKIEAFAGRIGSILDVGLSLFRLDTNTGHLVLVAGNNHTLNPVLATDGSTPLSFDSLLTVGLTAGDYYLAVSAGWNTQSPLEGQAYSPFSGYLDPETSHSGLNASVGGAYVLNLQLVEIPNPPEIIAASIAANDILTAVPTTLTVTFSQYVDLPSLFAAAYAATGSSALDSIFIEDSLGQKYYLRLTDYDVPSLTAQFVLFDRLADGAYELHLSGSLGLTDVAGQLLVGNAPSGDYVVAFAVATGLTGNPLVRTYDGQSESPATPQDLGPLFPQELSTGVAVQRAVDVLSGDTADYFRFTVVHHQNFAFLLSGTLPSGVALTLFDANGNTIPAAVSNNGRTLLVQLNAGVYDIKVGNWLTGDAPTVTYSLLIQILGLNDNPPPLLSGPAPGVGLRLASAVVPPPQPSPPPFVPPVSDPVPPAPVLSLQPPPAPFVAPILASETTVTNRVVLPFSLGTGVNTVTTGFSGQASPFVRVSTIAKLDGEPDSTYDITGLGELADGPVTGRGSGDATLPKKSPAPGPTPMPEPGPDVPDNEDPDSMSDALPDMGEAIEKTAEETATPTDGEPMDKTADDSAKPPDANTTKAASPTPAPVTQRRRGGESFVHVAPLVVATEVDRGFAEFPAVDLEGQLESASPPTLSLRDRWLLQGACALGMGAIAVNSRWGRRLPQWVRSRTLTGARTGRQSASEADPVSSRV